MKIGVDYYPEQWGSPFWEKDIEMMAQSGVKIVRIGDLAWSELEPEEGVFNFSSFDEIMRIFRKNNIEVVIGIPTSRPPLWLYQAHPEIIRTDRNGRRMPVGLKGQCCVNSPVFVDYTKKITEHLVRHYGTDTNIVAWQADNGTEAYPCTCDACRKQFRVWLKDKYDTIENINNALGTTTWIGKYNDISQIEPPSDYPESAQNPALCLEYARFCSDSMYKYVKEIMLTIKRECPKARVTADIHISQYNPDYYRLYSDLDFVSCSNYPFADNTADAEKNTSAAFFLDFVRGINGRSFWITEQHSSPDGNPLPMRTSAKPGQMAGYAFQALAHGADNILFYRWRSAVSGPDMFSQGLIDHSCVPGRRFYEFSEFCKMVSRIGALDTTEIISDVAILYNPDNEWAFRIQPQSEGFDYVEQLKNFHAAFTGYGANVDIVHPDSDLSQYKAVIAPSMYIYKKSSAENIYRYVVNGGTLILTSRSGVKDANNNCIMDTLPSVYKELVGAEVTEYDPVGKNVQTITDFAGKQFECSKWCDILRLTTAKAYAEYSDGTNKGCPAVTMNRYCSGVSYYIGTVGNKDFYKSLVGNIMRQTGLPRLKGLPDGVEVTTQTNGLNDFICFFNNSDKEASISLPKSMYSIIESIGKEKLDLRPFGFDILRK